MTHAHFFLIPTIFFFGFFLGGFLSQRNPQRNVIGQVQKNATIDASRNAFPRSSSGKILALSFAILLVAFVSTHLFSFFGGAKALGEVLRGAPIFDRLPSFSSAEVYARLDGMGEVGRAMYQRFTYTADLIFPLSLLTFLFFLSKFVSERTSMPTPVRTALKTLPFIWFANDMLENMIVFTLIAQFPKENVLLGSVLAWVTVTKFALLLLSIVVSSVSSVVYRENAFPALGQKRH